MIIQEWHVKPSDIEKSSEFASEFGVSPILAQLLINRGVKTIEAAKSYLYPTFTDLPDPFLMSELEKAVNRIRTAKERGEQICIYSATDVNGTMATALLLSIFRQLDVPADFYMADCFKEGHGLNKDVLTTLKDRGCNLLVTIACGITSCEEVQLANEFGLDVIILCSEHVLPDVLPPAYAVVTPYMQDSNCLSRPLADVAVAFKFAHGLMSEDGPIASLVNQLDLVVLGIIIDGAQLKGENRTFAKLGLEEINRRRRPGIQALCDIADVGIGKPIVAHTLNLVMGPRINASRRRETASTVVELLTAKSYETALPLAQKLNTTITEYREQIRRVKAEAIELIEKRIDFDTVQGLVIAQEGWRHDVIGLVASGLLKRYYRPLFLLAINGDEAHGVGRSIQGINLANSLKPISKLLIRHIGYQTAAGFTIKTKNIEAFKAHFNQFICKHFTEDDFISRQYFEDVPASHLTLNAIDEINLLGPFGEDNPPPQLAIRGLTPDRMEVLESRAWRLGYAEDYFLALKSPNIREDSVDLALTPEISEWNGTHRPQLSIKDLCQTPRFVTKDEDYTTGSINLSTAVDKGIKRKKWQVKSCSIKTETSSVLAESLAVSRLTAQLLVNRGIKTPEDAQTYLYPRFADLQNPFLMDNMDKAINRIHDAKKKGEQIWVYGDYDTDGTTAVALLLSVFRELDVPVRYYIPDRFREGYGLNQDAVKNLKAKGCDLVITVDCGITSINEVQLANDIEMDVIVTDHHQAPPDALPPAHAVITPKMADGESPLDGLAGVGLAFKLAHGLMGGCEPAQPLIDQLDLVVLGTVVDMATLTGENRTLTRLGLTEINHRKRPGIHALCEVAGFSEDKPIVGHTLGFVLGPRINAAGRMDTASKAVELLTAESYEAALPIAEELNLDNTRRREITHQIYAEALNSIEKDNDFDKVKGLVVADEKWNRGVVGIVASRVLERYYRPVFLLAIDGSEAHGSGRSIEGLNLADCLNACSPLLLKHGGHKAAAGLTIRTKNIEEFSKHFNQYANEHLSEDDLIPKVNLDFDVQLSDLTPNSIQEFNLLEPFGEGNPTPQLAIRGLTFRSPPRRVGKRKEHLRLYLTDGQRGANAVGWRMGQIAEQCVMVKQKKWDIKIPDTTKSSMLSEKLGVSPLVTQLLVTRGVETEETARQYLFPEFADLQNPLLMHDMKKAVDRIYAAKTYGEFVWICHDHDADGVTAAALLLDFFRELNVPTRPDILNHFGEDPGLTEKSLKTLRDSGCGLIITVARRSTPPKAMNLAQKTGIDVIIANHNQTNLDAESSVHAVIRPQIENIEPSAYDLTSVGLAFKLAHALVKGAQPAHLKKQLDLVVLGTVIDGARLSGENRTLTRLGLKEIQNRQRPGIRALCDVAKFRSDKSIVGHTLRYVFGARLNAAGRIGMGQKIVESLTTESYEEALPIVKELEEKISAQSEEKTETNTTPIQKLYLDFEAKASHLTVSEIRDLNLLEPFGEENWAPQLAIRGLTLRRPPRLMGKRNQHLKLSVTDGNHMLDAIGWGMANFAVALKSQNIRIDLAGTPEINEWQGTQNPQLIIKDIHIQTIDRHFQGKQYPSDDAESPVKILDYRHTDKKAYLSTLLEKEEPIVFYVRDEKAIDRFLDLIGPQTESIGRCDAATPESEIENLVGTLGNGKLLAIVSSRTLLTASQSAKHLVFCHPVCTPLAFYNRCQPAFRTPETTYIHLIYSAKDADSMHTLLSWQYPDEETLKRLYQTIKSLGSRSDVPIRLDDVVSAARTNSIPPDAVRNGMGIFEELKLIKSREQSSGKVVQLLPTPSEKRELHQSRTYLYGEQLKQTSAIFSEFQLKQSVQEIWKRVSYECRNSS